MKGNKKELVKVPNMFVLSPEQHRSSNYHSILRIFSSRWKKTSEQPEKGTTTHHDSS